MAPRDHSSRSRALPSLSPQVANDKVVKLSDHIEKLVLHLKHESAGKTKALRKLAKEVESKKSKVSSLHRKNAIKVRF